MQEAARNDFPARIADLQSEVKAQNQLHQRAKSACTSLERELQRMRGDATAKQEVIQATTESLQEARNEHQESEEVPSRSICKRHNAPLREI